MSGDYFAFLGVPRRLNLDAVTLERRFRAISRECHPDFFYNATPAERRACLERSSLLNDAYRALKHPISRIEYLLRLEGLPGGGAAATVPASLLEEVFNLNEELDAIREEKAAGRPPAVWMPRLEQVRHPIKARRAEHERQLELLAARWDALADAGAGPEERRPVLEALGEQMLERNYISNLLAGIEQELTTA